MDRVILIAFDGSQTLDITGPAEVFAAAGRHDQAAAYEIVIASTRRTKANRTKKASTATITTSSGCQITTRDLHELRPKPTDIVLVAGGDENGVRAAVADVALGEWILRASKKVRVMGSVCSGAFVLAALGLLDGLRVATHWSACDRLAEMRPAIEVDRDAIFVKQKKVWTSAGVTTGIDMALAMVEEDRGRAVADAVAARLVLYVRRPGFQSQFSSALVAQTTKASDPIASVIAWARKNLESATTDTLARRAAMSTRSFHRRVIDVTGTTPAKLIERLRVEHARTLLVRADIPSKVLASSCGFGSAARMNRAFMRAVGMLPREYRLLFGR